MRSQWLPEVPIGTGGLSARTPRTVRLGPADVRRQTADVHRQTADRPPSPPELHTVLSSFEVNNGLSAIAPQTVRLEAIFSKNIAKNLRY
jgi:hypothetical protein